MPIIAECHAKPIADRALAFGSMNVRSVTPLKLDDLLVELRDRSLDVLMLCETWHDVDSVSVCRLRADGFCVVERAHPRSSRSAASLAVNHGCVAIVAVPSVCLTAIDVGYQRRRRLNAWLAVCPQTRPASYSLCITLAHLP